MQKEVEADFLEVARATQLQTIKARLTKHYVGGKKAIDQWGDFTFSLCDFFGFEVRRQNPEYSLGKIKRRLDKLAKAGVLNRRKTSISDSIRYRFDRETCDSMAALALAELRAEGLEEEGRDVH